MSHYQDEFCDEYDDDDFNADHNENHDEHLDEDYENEDQQVSEDDSYDEDRLYRCRARFKGHIGCHKIFSFTQDILTHLKHVHKTHKWLVDTFVRIPEFGE